MRKEIFLFVIALIVTTASLGDESKRKDSLHNRKNLLSEIRVEKNKIFYLNQSISATEYEQIKKKEMNIKYVIFAKENTQETIKRNTNKQKSTLT